jgi:hypothetical protein
MSEANGDSGGVVMDCIYCEAKKPVSKPGSDTPDPGEAELRRLLAQSGVHQPVVTSGEQKEAPKAKSVTQTVTTPVTLESVIADLSSLPMPKSMKQFKAINKAIVLLQKALTEI